MACKPAKTRTSLAIAVACALAAALVQPGAAPARLGDLDASFDGDGIATPDVGSASARLEAVTTAGDGGPVAAGWAVNAGGIREPLVVRLTPGGATAGVTRVAGTVATELHGVAIDGADASWPPVTARPAPRPPRSS